MKPLRTVTGSATSCLRLIRKEREEEGKEEEQEEEGQEEEGSKDEKGVWKERQEEEGKEG